MIEKCSYGLKSVGRNNNTGFELPGKGFVESGKQGYVYCESMPYA